VQSSKFRTYIKEFSNLLFPNLCLGCSKVLYPKEELICTYCNMHLPRTNMHVNDDDSLLKRMVLHPELKSVLAFLYFKKHGTVQRLIHALKYNNRPQVGTILGKWYGAELRKANYLPPSSKIVAIPLHPSKLKRRGYNQAAYLADGIAQGLGATYVSDGIIRAVATESQTRKSRIERFDNMENVFDIKPEARHQLYGATIVLVDDVITTGATLSAAVSALKPLHPKEIHILTLAKAD
jgi:ComF family protein